MYKRIVLKISGESLGKNNIIDKNIMIYLTKEIIKIFKKKIQISIIIGGGNILRGKDLHYLKIDRAIADQTGMLSTIINGLILHNFLNKKNINTKIMSTFNIHNICEPYNYIKIKEYLKKNKIVIITSGIGNPLFTTDTAACLKAIETKSNILIKATKVNGVYNIDPNINKKAKFFSKISYNKIIKKNIKIMDTISFYIAKKHKLPIYIYNIYKKNALYNIIMGKKEGTLIY